MTIRQFLFYLLFLFSPTIWAQSDDCPAAEPLEVFEECRAIPSSTFTLNSFSTKNSCDGNTDDDGWFRFIAISPRTQVVVFSDQLANMAISVFEDCRTEIACVNERDMGGQEFLIFDTNIGKEYFVQVYDYTEGGGGFLICLTAEEEIFPSDCAGATIICENAKIAFEPMGAGNDDFESIGNDRGCLAKKENNAAWYYFEIAEDAPRNSTLTFTITPETSPDYDFALFGPNVVCENLSTPIRCSYADALCNFCPGTGLGMGAMDATEGSDGDGFLTPLIVQPGEGYYLLVDNESVNATGFNLQWGGNAAAFLNCPANLPCGLTIDAGNPILICDETELILTPQARGNTQSIKYQWRGTEETIGYLNSSITANPIVTLPPNFSGQIGYELTAFAGECTVSDSVFINKVCVDESTCPKLMTNLDLTPINCIENNSGSIQIGLISGGKPPYLFRLGNEDFQANPTFRNLPIGTYQITVQDQNGCESDTSITLIETELPTLEIGPDITVEQGELVDLQAISNFDNKSIQSVTWSNLASEDCPPPCITPNFIALQSGVIQATLETIDNCLITSELQLTVLPKIDIYIPSAFSPNGDGVNDYFSIFTGPGIVEISLLQIYDRWGNLVFEQTDLLPNDLSKGWNGTWQQKALDSGVYVYYAELEVVNDEPIHEFGEVFLIR